MTTTARTMSMTDLITTIRYCYSKEGAEVLQTKMEIAVAVHAQKKLSEELARRLERIAANEGY